jgi:hypothetical protein
MFDDALSAIKKIADNPNLSKYPWINDRIKNIRAEILLKKGDTNRALTLIKSLNYHGFQVLGPFNSATLEDYNSSVVPGLPSSSKRLYPARYSETGWVQVKPDPEGIIKIDEVYPDTPSSLFYLYNEFDISCYGDYDIILGKTGYTDIWIDSELVFKNREEHHFYKDQYYCRIKLAPGRHRILIKTGDSSGSLKISLRISNSAAIVRYQTLIDAGIQGIDSQTSDHDFFPSLKELHEINSVDPRDIFNAAYLHYSANLHGENSSRIENLFSKIPQSHPLFEAASIYLAKNSKDPETADFRYRFALSRNPRNIEALYGLSMLNIRHGMYHSAEGFINQIRITDRDSHLATLSQTALFKAKGWHDKALRVLMRLKGTEYGSLADAYEAEIEFRLKNFSKASILYKKLYENDRKSIHFLKALVKCLELTRSNEKAVDFLSAALVTWPSAVLLRLELARLAKTKDGLSSSLPILTAAISINPYHKKTLFETGITYHLLGKIDLARYYLNLSSRYDPDNFFLRKYIDRISGNPPIKERLGLKVDLSFLKKKAESYNNEPVLNLLDEKIISLNNDGSHEKHERRIILINDSSADESIKNQYIVYEPGLEKVDEIKCLVYCRGRSREVLERLRRSLSDPESKLYYDLQAIIIPINSLENGSIIDFQYTLRNSSGKTLKNYFCDKTIFGGKYRSIKSRYILQTPSRKKLNCRLKAIPASGFKQSENSQKKIYSVELEDLPPVKQEKSMPNISVLLPQVTFSSLVSWDDFYSWYSSIIKNSININDEMKQFLKSIPAGAAPLEKAAAIYSHLTDEIRYVGFEFGIGSIRPRRTDLTYRSRMGDCKDISLLLTVMLRQAGIDASMALVRTRDKGPADLVVPNAGEFNHAICYVNLQGGFFLDGTAKFTGIKELPHNDRNIQAYIISDKAGQFKNTMSDFYEKSRTEIENRIIIAEDGSARLMRTITKIGGYAPAARMQIFDKKKALKSLNEYWNSLYPGSSLYSYNALELKYDSPVSYSYSVLIPNFSRIYTDSIIFSPFINSSGYYESYCMLKIRHYPVDIHDTGSVITANHIEIPEGYNEDQLPMAEKKTGPGYYAEFMHAKTGKTIVSRSEVNIMIDSCSIKEYAHFRDFTRFISSKEHERILIKKR